MIVKNYFPTRIFTDTLVPEQAASLNARLLDLIRAERGRDPAGTPKSTYRELGSWHSHTHLHKEPEYAEILEFIQKSAAFVSDTNGYDPRYMLKVTTMWSIINPPGGSNMSHVHPGCVWSGVYYLQAPEKSGNISFIDPRTPNVMQDVRYDEKQPRKVENKTKISIMPEAGKIVIFPSWLYHGVAPNMSDKTGIDAERVIISFNLSQRLA
jgi:uncharacterized protein (TIGR02466 family)